MKEMQMERYWINAPSTTDYDMHEHHGTNVIAPRNLWDGTVTVYPAHGLRTSMVIETRYLSKGWRTRHEVSASDHIFITDTVSSMLDVIKTLRQVFKLPE